MLDRRPESDKRAALEKWVWKLQMIIDGTGAAKVIAIRGYLRRNARSAQLRGL